MYKWKLESFEGEPEKVAMELKKIEGDLTKFKIVTYAELHPDSELYKCFNWEDKSAAFYWRLDQATMIMRSLVIIKEFSNGPEKISLDIRVFESIHSGKNENGGEEREYIEVESALSDEHLRNEIINDIILMLKKAQNKLKKYNMIIAEHEIVNIKLEDTITQLELITEESEKEQIMVQ